ncbi:MAG: hypothetical protein JWM05_228, partial [Acidimicrobiales bacterium]|nr:hypothetical protein [Acidimicrobiales bacterium]
PTAEDAELAAARLTLDRREQEAKARLDDMRRELGVPVDDPPPTAPPG